MKTIPALENKNTIEGNSTHHKLIKLHYVCILQTPHFAWLYFGPSWYCCLGVSIYNCFGSTAMFKWTHLQETPWILICMRTLINQYHEPQEWESTFILGDGVNDEQKFIRVWEALFETVLMARRQSCKGLNCGSICGDVD